MSKEFKKEEKSAEITETGSPKTPKSLWHWKLAEQESRFSASWFAPAKPLVNNVEDASPATENNAASFQ
jgi:hypothetical protein